LLKELIVKKLIVFGCGKQAKNIYKVLKFEGVAISGFCVDDEYYTEDSFFDKPMYKTSYFLSNCSPEEYIVFLPLSAQNRCKFRKDKFLQFEGYGYEFYTFISKGAMVYSDSENIGRNVFIGHGAGIGPDAIIKDNCCISEFSLIGHDAIIDKHTFIASGAIIGASSRISERVVIALGVIIREDTYVAEGSVLGMGITIHRDIEKTGIYVFSPLEENHFGKSLIKK
jgi:carbonic anhydrase/acetyltransferase-like protein (isoleucine patch superfamily)